MLITRLFFTVLLFFATSSGCSQTGGANSRMKAFEWLEGNWKMEKKNGLLVERWEQASDTGFNGNSYFVHAGGEKLLEKIQLIYTNGQYYYIPSVVDQNNGNAVRFAITRIIPGSFVAENPQHDFPRRITYQSITKDSIHSWIDDGKPVPEKRSAFYYTRQKDE